MDSYLKTRKVDKSIFNKECTDEYCKLLLSMVHGNAVRSLLFESELTRRDEEAIIKKMRNNRLGKSSNVVSIMRCIISLTFISAISRWRQVYNDPSWGDEDAVESFKSSRFSKLFISAIEKEDISLDLQIFSLIELWVCLRDHGDVYRSCFAGIFAEDMAGENIGLILQDAREAIRTSYKNIARGKYTLEYCKQLCFMLLCCFPFIKDMNIDFINDGTVGDAKSFSITYQYVYGGQITLYPNELYNDRIFVLTQEQLDTICGNESMSTIKLYLYYLSESSVFNDTVQHTYRSFEDSETEIKIEQSQTAESATKPFSNKRDLDEMRKFLSFNYKNIREFAMIISDAIKKGLTVRRNIITICQEKYPKLLPDEEIDINSKNLYWDNIITLLLVEMGPSNLLEVVLEDETIFFNIIEQIGWRCVGREEIKNIRNNYIEKVVKLHDYCKNNDALLESEVLAFRVRKVLEAMDFINENTEEAVEFMAFEETLSYKYERITECIAVLEQYKQKNVDLDACESSREDLIQIFRRIFLFLQIFYTGMDAYALENEKYDAEKHKDEPEEDYKDRLHKIRMACLDSFTNAATAKYSEIEDNELTELFDGFCTLCERYVSRPSDRFEKDSEPIRKMKRLNKLITRSYICDPEKLRFFVTIKLENGQTSTIFKMLENFSGKYYRDINYGKWLEYFIDCFFFLIYNEDYSRHGIYKQEEELKDKDCDPIYPYLITYYNQNVDRDSIKKFSYRVPVPVAGGKANAADQGFIVTLLSERDVPAGPHFCIPLRYGSSDNWWINPFLIPRMFVRRMEKKFNEVRKNGRKE